MYDLRRMRMRRKKTKRGGAWLLLMLLNERGVLQPVGLKWSILKSTVACVNYLKHHGCCVPVASFPLSRRWQGEIRAQRMTFQGSWLSNEIFFWSHRQKTKIWGRRKQNFGKLNSKTLWPNTKTGIRHSLFFIFIVIVLRTQE